MSTKQLLDAPALLPYPQCLEVVWPHSWYCFFLAHRAHDWSVQGKRQTITAEDVLRGLEDAQLFEFIPQLQETLESELLVSRACSSKAFLS